MWPWFQTHNEGFERYVCPEESNWPNYSDTTENSLLLLYSQSLYTYRSQSSAQTSRNEKPELVLVDTNKLHFILPLTTNLPEHN